MFKEAIGHTQDFYFKKVWGITREYPELNGIGATGLLVYSIIDQRIHHTEIRGKLPPVGHGGIVVSNHSSSRDPIKAVSAFREFGRTMQCFTRDTLLDPTIKEDPTVLAAKGKKENDLDKLPLWIRQIRAKAMRDVGSIPIRRGAEMPLKAIRFALTRLDNNTLVASFLQQTRIPEGDLRDLFEGAAFLACQRPNTLVVPVGNSKDPDLFNIGEWFTYTEAKKEANFDIPGLEETQRMAICLADRVAPLLPPVITDRWFDGQRLKSINRFKSQIEAKEQKRLAKLQARRTSTTSA